MLVMDQDPTYPYFLHPFYHLALILVSQALGEDNYNSWSLSTKMTLNANRKLGFVDGFILHPPDEVNPALIFAWQCTNDIVSSWLSNCISMDIEASDADFAAIF